MALAQEHREERILRGRDRLLRALASGIPVEAVLRQLACFAEEILPETHTTVLLVEGDRLRHVAAPSLPRAYIEEVDGITIRSGLGSCPAAASGRKRVIVEDVLDHPNWAGLEELIAVGGFRACWSEPILSPRGEVLGTFAMYHDRPRRPDDFELELIHSAAQFASVALTMRRTQASLIESERRFRQLAESIQEVFWLTDWKTNKVLYVSPAYERVWGHSRQELYDDPANWTVAIHPEDRDRVYEAFVRGAQDGTYEEEYRIFDGEGRMRWIHDRAFPILDEEGTAYRVCGLSTDITERKVVEDERRRADKQALESLTSELLLAEERERRNLAEDLHDGPNQILTLAQMKLDSALQGAPAELRPELTEVSKLITEANEAARTLTFQISPPVLHDFGFEPAVQWLAEDIERNYGIAIQLREDETIKPLDERIRVLLYRAVRELLINVAKHAQATRAHIELRNAGAFLKVEVRDDGEWSDPAHLESGRGMGLRAIRERLSHMGGRMEICSAPDQGTSITLYAPLLETTS